MRLLYMQQSHKHGKLLDSPLLSQGDSYGTRFPSVMQNERCGIFKISRGIIAWFEDMDTVH